MAWVKLSIGVDSDVLYAREFEKTLPSSATTEYTSLIDFMGPSARNNNRWVSGYLNASAVTGTNLDISLHMSEDAAGTTKILLLDALVADITVTGVNPFLLDLNAYPGAYYWIGWLADGDESANNITTVLFVKRMR